MCGHAGFARHPHASGLTATLGIQKDLTLAAQRRGKHATGFAVLSARSSFLKKWAMSMDALVKAGLYKREIEDGVPRKVRYVLGHTRHATLPNKDDDNAAHPFAFEHTVGCHNGSITNWRDVQKDNDQAAWLTDSQAALWAIDQYEDPADALKLLDGWWALAWVKNGKLFLTRTEERPLAVAYSKKLKTLYWASEREQLRKVLKAHEVKANVWDLSADTIYEFEPKKFNSKAHPTKTKVKLNRPSAKLATKNDVPLFQGDFWERKQPHKFRSARTWVDNYNAKPTGNRVQTLAGFIKEVDAKFKQTDDRIDKLEAEVEFLYSLIDEMGGIVHDGEAQCRECGFGTERDDLLRLPDGDMIHAGCVLK